MVTTSRVLVVLSALFHASRASAFSPPQIVLHPQQDPSHSSSDPRLGAVASESKLCSRIGTELLRAGGNAADALVGTVFCVGVVGMYHSGIGGGGFMLVRSASGEYESIDFRETAPAAASEDMYVGNRNGSVFGGLAAGVPGQLRGLEYLHQRYGKLSWESVMRPAIELAEGGFKVGTDLVRYMDVATNFIFRRDFLVEEPAWAEDFAPNGRRVREGDVLTRKRLAETLRAVAKGGADAFYTGPIAEATARAVRASNGSMTLEDLRDYKIKLRAPLQSEYRDFKLTSVGAPASGAVVLSAFKTIEGYAGMNDAKSTNLSTHYLDEALRFAYAERSSLGDPDFVSGTAAHQDTMLSSASAARKRSKISSSHTLPISDYNPDGYEILENHGTSHIGSADASGLAISLTTTINLIFGGGVIVPSTGVILNNQMNDFSTPNTRNEFGYPPSPSNYILAHKRPLSSIAPVIVEHRANNTLYYVLGSAGGAKIISAVAQLLWHALDRNMSAIAALYEPRFHDQLIPNVIAFECNSTNPDCAPDGKAPHDLGFHPLGESGVGTGAARAYDNATIAFMRGRGHNVTWMPQGYSSAQALRMCWNGTFEAAGEPRQRDSGGFAV
ncbi:gamma-glutamyltranspeptidase [Karstenula rhodostoma CBS 690.94]|uniref:Glutathione hydrolase n=1 Tax=Karstenula rhodostoma CBS 690.94 TaxID=1392251 RepID=A0A9P4PP83_9PLEO|nr:gamma-glutamyltranspeptidase [Karstenula rhodostoma CBS 690.94]